MKVSPELKCWELVGNVRPSKVLEHLEIILDDESVVSFELHPNGKNARAVYAKYPTPLRITRWRDTIMPRTAVCHVRWNDELKKTILEQLDDEHTAEWFWHIKAYRYGKLWMSYHDADSHGDPILSPFLDEDAASAFAKALGCGLARVEWSDDCWTLDRRELKSQPPAGVYGREDATKPQR